MKKQYTEQDMRDFSEFYRKTQGNCTPELWGKDLLEAWKADKIITVKYKKDEKWEVISYFNLHLSTVMEAQVQPSDLGDPTRWAIYSVKRLSDDNVFRVGEVVNYGTIEKFFIGWAGMEVHFTNGSGAILASVYKLPERIKLFTTEDGTDIFNPDSEVYYISGFKVIPKKAKNIIYLNNKKFYLLANAQEYALMNSPILSVNDILKMDLNLGTKDVVHVYKDKLIEEAKSKL